MAKVERGRRFLFDVEAYLTDPAVLAMGVLGRGAYGGALLPALWNQPEPGVVEADDALLAQLAMCTPDEWASVRDRVARAFDLKSRPGYWIQRRMVAEHAAQCVVFSRTSAAARVAGRASADKRLATARSTPVQRSVDAPSTGYGVGSGESNSKAEAARERAHARLIATRKPRRRAEPLTELTPADVARAAQLTGVPLATAEHLAERIRLEGPQRGYLNYPSALLNWCKREAERAPQTNGHSEPERPAPKDGDRANSPVGPVVWWQGSWRSPGEARDFGWKP